MVKVCTWDSNKSQIKGYQWRSHPQLLLLSCPFCLIYLFNFLCHLFFVIQVRNTLHSKFSHFQGFHATRVTKAQISSTPSTLVTRETVGGHTGSGPERRLCEGILSDGSSAGYAFVLLRTWPTLFLSFSWFLEHIQRNLWPLFNSPGNLLHDSHKNFENWFRNSWDNWGQSWHL